MKRRTFLNRLAGVSLLLFMPAFAREATGVTQLIKSRSEWRALLPRARYEGGYIVPTR